MKDIPEIPEDKVRAAYERCVQDPKLARYYANAPEGAQSYIALEFYLAVYGDEVGADSQEAYRREVEAELSAKDLAYLIRQTDDPAERDHLTALLVNHGARPATRRAAVATPVASAAAEPSVEASARPMKLKSVAEQRRTLQQEAFQQGTALQEEAVADVEARWRREARRETWQNIGAAFKGFFCWLLILAILAGGGWYVWTKFLKEEPASAEEPADVATTESTPTNVVPEKVAPPAESVRRQEAEAAAAREALAAQRAAEVAKQADVRQKVLSRKQRYEDILRRFKEAKLDYWKNAPAEDRPGKAKVAMTFNCLVPAADGSGDVMLFELTYAPGKPMEARILSAATDPAEISREDFNRFVAGVPYFVMREDRAYFCSEQKGVKSYVVPLPGDNFNPSREVFGALFPAMEKLNMPRPSLSWRVLFRPKDADADIEVAVASYGENLTRTHFFNKVREAMEKRGMQQARRQAVAKAARKVKKRTVVLYDGDVIKRDINGVTQVPRNFTYSSSNRHKYYWDTHAHNDEIRKEEQARAKWQKLYDEALRQQRAEEDLQDAKTATVNVDISEDDVQAVLNLGKVTLLPAN